MPNEDVSSLRIDKTAAQGFQKRRRRPFFALAVIIAIIGAVFLYFGGFLSPATEVEIVTVSSYYPSQAVTLLNASGYVVAQRKASVASKVTGLLTAINVEEGAAVRKGDVIARLEHADAAADRTRASEMLKASQAQLAETEAEMKNAEAELIRGKDLAEKGYISKSDFDAIRTRHDRAKASVSRVGASVRADKAALSAADVALGYTVIRAPFDAVVLTKNADIGDIITPLGAAANAKAAVVTIADMSSLQIEVDVSESNLGQVKIGQPCEMQLDALPDARFRGEVHMIVPTADRTKAAVLVKVRFIDTDSRILPEMSAKVAFLERPVTPDELKPRTAVSPSALVVSGDRTVAYLVKDGRALETPVTTGAQWTDMVEVLSGLNPGEKIVARPSGKIRDGERVKASTP